MASGMPRMLFSHPRWTISTSLSLVNLSGILSASKTCVSTSRTMCLHRTSAPISFSFRPLFFSLLCFQRLRCSSDTFSYSAWACLPWSICSLWTCIWKSLTSRWPIESKLTPMQSWLKNLFWKLKIQSLAKAILAKATDFLRCTLHPRPPSKPLKWKTSLLLQLATTKNHPTMLRWCNNWQIEIQLSEHLKLSLKITWPDWNNATTMYSMRVWMLVILNNS